MRAKVFVKRHAHDRHATQRPSTAWMWWKWGPTPHRSHTSQWCTCILIGKCTSIHIQALVKHHLRLSNRDTCVVNAEDEWIRGRFNVCILSRYDWPASTRSSSFVVLCHTSLLKPSTLAQWMKSWVPRRGRISNSPAKGPSKGIQIFAELFISTSNSLFHNSPDWWFRELPNQSGQTLLFSPTKSQSLDRRGRGPCSWWTFTDWVARFRGFFALAPCVFVG